MSTLNRFAKILLISVFAVWMGGCKKDNTGSSSRRQVNLAIWGNYLTPEMAAQFETKTGIKLNISYYTSNEELLAKVQAGASGIDVAVPSDYMVGVMAKLGLLAPLDKKEIPNASAINPQLLKQIFDKENTYSFPYAWTTAGFAVNRELFKGKISGWKDVFANPELSGKISLLDDVREVAAVALKVNGYSVNSTNPAELKKAEETLLKVKSKVKTFKSDTIDLLLNKEVAVAHTYSSDGLRAAEKSGGKIEYILPEEGGTKAIDNVVVFKNTKNKAEAHALVNFLLSPEVNLSFVKTMWGGPVLTSTREKLPQVFKDNKALFPTSQAIAKFDEIRDVEEATQLYDELWTRVKTE